MNEIVHTVCYWGIILCAALSLLPFRLTRRWKSWPLYLPAVGIAFLTLYWTPLMKGLNVHGDMRLMLPLMLFVWVNGMVKVGLVWVLDAWQGNNSAQVMALPQRSVQMMGAISILACGLLVF